MFGYYLDLALRSLLRNQVLTMLMVVAIAVGIGASMTTLTVMHLLSGDPIPGRSAHLFFPQLDPEPNRRGATEPMDVMDYQSAMDLWRSHLADRQTLIVSSSLKVQAPDTKAAPLLEAMLSTTSDFFPMFKVPFQYGSGWSADDDTKHARMVVISADLNARLFGGANSVGHTLRLRDTTVQVVGVLAPWRPSPLFFMVQGGRFAHGDTADFYGRPQDVITPFATGLEINDGNFHQFTCWHAPTTLGHLVDAPCEWVTLWVQLDDAAKVAKYRRFLEGYARQQKTRGRFTSTLTSLRSLMQWLDYNRVIPSDVHLQAGLAAAFLIICLFNTVGLLLAKFLRRGLEIGVRRALGASCRAVFAQCLFEAGLIGLIGGIGGWLLTLLGLSVVRQQPVAYADLAHLDIPMFLATFLLSVAVSLVAGALPALRASRITPSLQLKAL